MTTVLGKNLRDDPRATIRNAASNQWLGRLKAAYLAEFNIYLAEGIRQAEAGSSEPFSRLEAKRMASRIYRRTTGMYQQMLLAGRELAADDFKLSDFLSEFKLGKAAVGVGPPSRFVLQEKLDGIDEWAKTTAIGSSDAMAEQLIRTFKKAEDAEETPADIAKRLKQDGLVNTDAKANMLARTGVIYSYNEGALAAYEESGVAVVEWFTVADDARCPFCESLHGVRIPTGENFVDQGQEVWVETTENKRLTLSKNMPFDIKHPPLHPHCRCALIPVIDPATLLKPKKEKPSAPPPPPEKKPDTKFTDAASAAKPIKVEKLAPPKPPKPTDAEGPVMFVDEPAKQFNFRMEDEFAEHPKGKYLVSRSKKAGHELNLMYSSLQEHTPYEAEWLLMQSRRIENAHLGLAEAAYLRDQGFDEAMNLRIRLRLAKDELLQMDRQMRLHDLGIQVFTDPDKLKAMRQLHVNAIQEVLDRTKEWNEKHLDKLARVRFESNFDLARFEKRLAPLATDEALKAYHFSAESQLLIHPETGVVLAGSSPGGINRAAQQVNEGTLLKPLDNEPFKGHNALTRTKEWEQWQAALEPGERNALHDWTTHGSTKIRRCQRKFEEGCDRNTKRRIKLMSDAIKKAPRHNGIVYRGLSLNKDDLKKLVSSEIMQFNEFNSATLDPEVGRSFGVVKKGMNGVVLKIKQKNGVWIEPLSGYKSEKEVLLLPKQKFKITDVKKEKTKHGFRYQVEMEEINA